LLKDCLSCSLPEYGVHVVQVSLRFPIAVCLELEAKEGW
jgi:hypothetical protein